VLDLIYSFDKEKINYGIWIFNAGLSATTTATAAAPSSAAAPS
jgi:hypothetical protein